MAILLSNLASSRLASSITAAATTLAVTTGEGAKFPSPGASDWFPLALIKASGVIEIVRCTARSGDVLTITRAQEGTSAQAFSAGDRVELRMTAAVIADMVSKTATAQTAANTAQSAANTAQGEVDALELLAVVKDANTTTGAARLPSGTTAQRPGVPSNGMMRYNSTTGEHERYQGGKWLPFNEFDKAINEGPLTTIGSATTVDIGAAAANTIQITGTNAITAFDNVAIGIVRRLVFFNALTLTHNATSLILPTGANITTATGDTAEFVSLGSGNWRCLRYNRASGQPLAMPATTFTKEYVSPEQVFTAAGLLTLTHGLGSKPKLIAVTFVCQVANLGYSVGDELPYPHFGTDASGSTGLSIVPSDTQLSIRMGINGFILLTKDTGTTAFFTPANWRMIVRAWA